MLEAHSRPTDARQPAHGLSQDQHALHPTQHAEHVFASWDYKRKQEYVALGPEALPVLPVTGRCLLCPRLAPLQHGRGSAAPSRQGVTPGGSASFLRDVVPLKQGAEWGESWGPPAPLESDPGNIIIDITTEHIPEPSALCHGPSGASCWTRAGGLLPEPPAAQASWGSVHGRPRGRRRAGSQGHGAARAHAGQPPTSARAAA